jgi:hypothetical protein
MGCWRRPGRKLAQARLALGSVRFLFFSPLASSWCREEGTTSEIGGFTASLDECSYLGSYVGLEREKLVDSHGQNNAEQQEHHRKPLNRTGTDRTGERIIEVMTLFFLLLYDTRWDYFSL